MVGAGGSSAPGEVLAAVAGRGSPLPVFAIGGPTLPGWVGPMVPHRCGVGLWPDPEIPHRGPPEGTTSRQFGAGSGGAVPAARDVCQRPWFWPVSRLKCHAGRAESQVPAVALSAPLILLAGELGLVAHARHGLAGAASTLDERALACGVEVPSTDSRQSLEHALDLRAAAGLGQW